jgi:hypothetical protein
MPTPDALDDDLEDDDRDPLADPTRDLSRPVRKLAAAVLVRAVLDSKMRANPYFKEDATRFLYPNSDCARAHLQLMAELAGLSPAWLSECLVRTANSPRLRLRYCSKCKTPTPPDGFALHFHGARSKLCHQCREVTSVRPKCSHPGKAGRPRKALPHSGFNTES